MSFARESGGHRWQRIPPNEKRGRVQTSTVTVAVMPVPEESELRLDPRDVSVTTTRGTGPGGQARNKTESCVVATHRPTGITVRVDSRSQAQNREEAIRILRARVADQRARRRAEQMNSDRRRQVGSGQRGDKVRTVRVRDGIVTDHRTNRKTSLRRYQSGDLSELQ